jgi:hypothetical protein
MTADAPTPREFGRLEQRVETLSTEIAETRGELSGKIDALSASLDRSSTKQGERIGENERRLESLYAERRIVVALFMLIQAVFLTLFGVWIQHIARPPTLAPPAPSESAAGAVP